MRSIAGPDIKIAIVFIVAHRVVVANIDVGVGVATTLFGSASGRAMDHSSAGHSDTLSWAIEGECCECCRCIDGNDSVVFVNRRRYAEDRVGSHSGKTQCGGSAKSRLGRRSKDDLACFCRAIEGS